MMPAMPPVDLTPLFGSGAIGAVLAWFMFKMDPRIQALEQAQDRNTKILALALIAMDDLSSSVKIQAQQILTEVNDTERIRGK